MKPWKILAIVALLTTVTLAQSQSPVDGGKAGNGPLLSPYGQIGSPLPKAEEKPTEKKTLDLEAPYMEPDKVPLGAIPRDEVPAPYSRFFFSGEYIGWNLNNTTVNPVIFNVPVGIVGAPIDLNNGLTTNSFIAFSTQTPQSQTQLSQNGVIDYGIQNGMRFSGGIAIDPESGLAIVGNAIIVPTASYQLSSNTSFNMVPVSFQTGLSSQVPIGGTSTQNGNTQVADVPVVVPRNIANEVFATVNNFIGGGELDLKGKDIYIGDIAFSGLLGFRYFQFNESLTVNSNYTISQITVNTAIGQTTPDRIQGLVTDFSSYQQINSKSSDYIKVYNHFYGPQIGINSFFRYNNFSVDCNGKLGIGVLHQVANVDAVTIQTFTINNGDGTTSIPKPSTARAGLLYSPYDVGRHSRSQFGLLPELNVKLGYRIFEKLKITAGYDFLLVANVLRASNQSQLVPYTTQMNYSGMNVQQQSSTQSIQIPAFTFDNSTLIINGISFGAQLDF